MPSPSKADELAALRRIADAAITLAYGEQTPEVLPALQAAILAARAFLRHPALPKEEPPPELVHVSMEQVLGYLQEHPGSTCQAIGAALRASSARVRGILYYAKHRSRTLARHARQIFLRLHGATPEAYIKVHRAAAFGQMPYPLAVAFDIRNHDPQCFGRCGCCCGPLQHDGAAHYCAYCDSARSMACAAMGQAQEGV